MSRLIISQKVGPLSLPSFLPMFKIAHAISSSAYDHDTIDTTVACPSKPDIGRHSQQQFSSPLGVVPPVVASPSRKLMFDGGMRGGGDGPAALSPEHTGAGP